MIPLKFTVKLDRFSVNEEMKLQTVKNMSQFLSSRAPSYPRYPYATSPLSSSTYRISYALSLPGSPAHALPVLSSSLYASFSSSIDKVRQLWKVCYSVDNRYAAIVRWKGEEDNAGGIFSLGWLLNFSLLLLFFSTSLSPSSFFIFFPFNF